jgi:hypothetical protein
MTGPTRRRFVLSLAGLVPLPFVVRRLHALAVADLDPLLLRALATAVLPTELGGARVGSTVLAFQGWLAGYREGAELLHGYGSGEIHRQGPSPALRWAGQLRELDAAARRNGGKSFARLGTPARQDLVRAALADAPGSGLPPVDRAPHIATGLLAFFYGTPEATDLCYEAVIGRNGCRPLEDSPRRPLPIARRR